MFVNRCANRLFALAALDARPGKVAVDSMCAEKSAFLLLSWIHAGARHKAYIERDCEAVRFAGQRAPEGIYCSRVLKNEVVRCVERAIPDVVAGGSCNAGEESDVDGDNQRAHRPNENRLQPRNLFLPPSGSLPENTAGRQPRFRAKLVPKISVKNYMSEKIDRAVNLIWDRPH